MEDWAVEFEIWWHETHDDDPSEEENEMVEE